MRKAVVDAGVPVLVNIAMVVGMEPPTADFRRIARQPRTIVVASVGQLVIGGHLIAFLTLNKSGRKPPQPAVIRVVAVTYDFIRDPIALGGDVSRHQSIEHLSSLQAIPGQIWQRPGDAVDAAEGGPEVYRIQRGARHGRL